jgi:hypothetical protein
VTVPLVIFPELNITLKAFVLEDPNPPPFLPNAKLPLALSIQADCPKFTPLADPIKTIPETPVPAALDTGPVTTEATVEFVLVSVAEL